MTKTYQIEGMEYRSKGPKWEFTCPRYSYTAKIPGGAVNAHKVARIIAGAVKRNGTIDGLARANMAKLFHSAAHPVSNLVNH